MANQKFLFKTQLNKKQIDQDLDFIPMDNFGVDLDAVIHWVLQLKISDQGVEEEEMIINKVVVDVTWFTDNEDFTSHESTQVNHKEITYQLEDCSTYNSGNRTTKPYNLTIDNDGCTVMF